MNHKYFPFEDEKFSWFWVFLGNKNGSFPSSSLGTQLTPQALLGHLISFFAGQNLPSWSLAEKKGPQAGAWEPENL
jgi:hypothetical protein